MPKSAISAAIDIKQLPSSSHQFKKNYRRLENLVVDLEEKRSSYRSLAWIFSRSWFLLLDSVFNVLI